MPLPTKVDWVQSLLRVSHNSCKQTQEAPLSQVTWPRFSNQKPATIRSGHATNTKTQQDMKLQYLAAQFVSNYFALLYAMRNIDLFITKCTLKALHLQVTNRLISAAIYFLSAMKYKSIVSSAIFTSQNHADIRWSLITLFRDSIISWFWQFKHHSIRKKKLCR